MVVLLWGATLLLTVLWTTFTTKDIHLHSTKNIIEYPRGEVHTSFLQLLADIPLTMWRLAIVQFFFVVRIVPHVGLHYFGELHKMYGIHGHRFYLSGV
jgi:hypothetical protein